MSLSAESQHTTRLSRFGDMVSMVGGLAIVGLSFLTMFVVDDRGGRWRVPPGTATNCSAWVACPGKSFVPDFSASLRWLVILVAVITIIVPAIRILSGRPTSSRIARLQLVGDGCLLLAMALVFALVTWQARSVGYEEWIYQFYLRPYWVSVGIFIAMTAVFASTVVVRIAIRRSDRAAAQTLQ